MEINFWVILGAGVVPLITGAIWYSAIFGKSWARTVGKSEEELKKGFNAPLVFTLTVVFGILSAFQLSNIVIHQMGLILLSIRWGFSPCWLILLVLERQVQK